MTVDGAVMMLRWHALKLATLDQVGNCSIKQMRMEIDLLRQQSLVFSINIHMVGAVRTLNSAFGVISDKPMTLSSLGCYGSETSLLNCRYSAPSSSCDKYDIAGVTCEGMLYQNGK